MLLLIAMNSLKPACSLIHKEGAVIAFPLATMAMIDEIEIVTKVDTGQIICFYQELFLLICHQPQMIVQICFPFGLLYFTVHGLSGWRLRIQLVLLFIILALFRYNVGLLTIQLKGEVPETPCGYFSFYLFWLELMYNPPNLTSFDRIYGIFVYSIAMFNFQSQVFWIEKLSCVLVLSMKSAFTIFHQPSFRYFETCETFALKNSALLLFV